MKLFPIFKKVFSIFFPNHCLTCHAIIAKDGVFCHDCWPKLSFITEPKCGICSYPFDVEINGMQPLCSRCLAKRPSFQKSVIIFRYNHLLKKAIGDLKYRDQTYLAKKFAKLLFEKARQEIASADLIVAVPLHIKKLRKRKFNQMVLIGKALEKLAQKKFSPDFLLKVKFTKSQAELRKKEREKNLKRAFLVNRKYRDGVKGKKVILLDDVMTTGATIENCAKELKRRGAREVVVLAIAKTVFRTSSRS